VKFNGVQGDVILAYSNFLGVSIPDNATSGKITVQVGNDMITGPDYTIEGPQYHIKFKAAGISKTFEACSPGYQSTTMCGTGSVPFADEDYDPHAEISVCDNVVDKVTAAVIESWAGDKFLFGDANPAASLRFFENQIEYASHYASSQAGSELIITTITREPANEDNQVAYKITGTFKCNVATVTGDDIAITEGEFVIRFTEYDL
jgi:hypothetical protein